MLVISHSIELRPLYMSDIALRPHLLSPFECNLLVLDHLGVCHADAWYVTQQAL